MEQGTDPLTMQPAVSRVRQRLAVGAGAALLSGAAMVASRLLVSAPTPIDSLFDLTGHLLGVPAVFNVIHGLPYGLDHYAKYALFGTMALAYVILWTAVALPLTRLTRAWRLVVPVLVTPALMGLVLLPLEGLGAFGLDPNNYVYRPWPTHLWAAAFGAVYGAVLLVARRGGAVGGRVHDAGRREVLGRSARGLLVLALGLGTARLALGALARAAAQLEGLLSRIRGLGPVITPVGDHYVVSKNFSDPRVDGSRWQLKLHGLVEHPLELKLSDLEALPSVTRSTTLICISNEVGGHLVGNSLWTGVPMADLLEMAGLRPEATHLILRAADNYSDSFPLDVARRDGTMVAYRQDGEPLVRGHGFPARVLAPGIYGMKSVKWLVDIEAVDHDYTGYWEQRGWSPTAVVHTMSRIDTPTATVLGGDAAIGGIAFAGLRGIRTVEVSTDGGKGWQEATLRPADNAFSWTLWGFEWQTDPGQYEVLVRAVDGTGAMQTAERSQPLPDGATGYHKLNVRVG
jgi:DMSO/TMAO reductase YedYZ molybdopterin-dependent catalytic subunit